MDENFRKINRFEMRGLFRKKDIAAIVNDSLLAEKGAAEGKEGHRLQRTLGVFDLTAFGIAAIIGAGVFSTIGNAAFNGGPAVSLLFVFTAIACGFSALCYAQFASAIPVSGSAYTYAYASFGELVAWIIGWDLLMEYAIGNIAVAISWSRYFTGLMESYGLVIPPYLTMDFMTASQAFKALTADPSAATPTLTRAFEAWQMAPQFFGIHLVCDLPALVITFIVTAIVYVGIEESRKFSNAMVVTKVLIVLLVICVGGAYIHPVNWHPFAPHGAGGVLKGVSAVFFAYIGFDAISTTAEECRNPQRDLPRGMFYSLVICTVLYVLVALVLTGIVSYSKLGVPDPLAFVFGSEGANLPWVHAIVSFGGVISLSTVLLVFQLGQPRIWMAMGRDGLLPPIFAQIHPKFNTPRFATILTGLVVAIPSLFLNLTEVTDLTSIGTLFAFMLVCGGVLAMDQQAKKSAGPEGLKNAKFKIPYVNSKYLFPGLVLGSLIFMINQNPHFFGEVLDRERILGTIFLLEMMVLAFFCFIHSFSLIPVLGLASCSYLISELGVTNWVRFGVWLLLGLCIYFFYGVRHSKLRLQATRLEL
jgi:APA family basic amino acid/polyamine antiporter